MTELRFLHFTTLKANSCDSRCGSLPIGSEHVNFAGMFSNQEGKESDNSSLVAK